MGETTLNLRRLSQQRLAGRPLTTPEQAVEWLGAVQAQDYYGAQWSLGLRMQHAAEGAIEQAFDEGRILRTHIMRPTWHFVTPADIRWIMALTAPRVHVANAYMYRQHGFDDAEIAQTNDIIAKALEGGQHLTRAEIGAMLADAGIEAKGNRLAYILMRAEMDLIVCSGPRRGKQFTYALLDERAPVGETLERDEALAELTRRYFTGHGPATEHDFAWWSGLTLTEAREGIDMAAGELHTETIDDEEYWFSEDAAASQPGPRAYLLPTFDELLVGYTDFDRTRRGGRDEEAVAFTSPILLDGEIAGSWRRTLKRSEVVVELAPFQPLADEEREAVLTAAERYGEFLGKTTNCAFV